MSFQRGELEPRMPGIQINSSVRLMLLLNSMSDVAFRPLPHNVGIKTVILAEKAGLIQREGSLGLRPRCKLTQAGASYRRERGYPTG